MKTDLLPEGAPLPPEIDARTMRVGDIDVSYLEAGTENTGLPWVFVHGLGEDATSWAEQQVALSASRPTYAVDVRGHGRTDIGRADGTLDQLAADLLGFLEQIGPSVCVGFSMGGAIVLAAAAAQERQLMNHAVCVCTSSVVSSRIAERFRERAETIHADGTVVARSALVYNLNSNVLNPPPTFEREVYARLRAIGDGRGYANGALAMASMNESPLTPRLSAVTCPVDVYVGEFDASCPQRAADIIVEAVQDGRSHPLAGVGHFVNIENPAVLTEALLLLDH